MCLIERIKNNLSHLFNFKDSFTVGDYTFDLYGLFYQENMKYFGSKKLKVYEFNNNEHLFLKDIGQEPIDLDEVKNCFMYLYNHFIEPDENHMVSVITLIYVVDKIDEHMVRKIKKFSFYKSYKFGFYGYVTGKLIVVDKSTSTAYESKAAKGDIAKMRLIV